MRVENNTPKSKPVYKSRIDRARENMKKRMAPHINDKKEKPKSAREQHINATIQHLQNIPKAVYKSYINRVKENRKKRMTPHINDKKEQSTPIQNTPIQRRPCMWNGSLMTSSKPKPKPKLPIKPVEVEDESSDDGYCKTHMYYIIKEKEEQIFSSSAIRNVYNSYKNHYHKN